MSELEQLKKQVKEQRERARARQVAFLKRRKEQGYKLVQLHLEPSVIEFLDKQEGNRADAVRAIIAKAMDDEEIDMDELLKEAGVET
ncbi:MAG: hypothetical protein R8K20_07380 [Gallionellaceae bacterium]